MSEIYVSEYLSQNIQDIFWYRCCSRVQQGCLWSGPGRLQQFYGGRWVSAEQPPKAAIAIARTSRQLARPLPSLPTWFLSWYARGVKIYYIWWVAAPPNIATTAWQYTGMPSNWNLLTLYVRQILCRQDKTPSPPLPVVFYFAEKICPYFFLGNGIYDWQNNFTLDPIKKIINFVLL